MNRRGFLRGLLGIPAALVASKIPFTTTASSAPAVLPYKVKTAFDAGVFYCPYIPLQGLGAATSRQNDLAPVNFNNFKSRYGTITQNKIKVYYDPTT